MADDTPLAGKRIAFTGRLASMTRAAAFEIVVKQGGSASKTVSRCTNVLVVGREGWPFAKDGRPTSKLRRAQTLSRAGYGIEILPEEAFLQQAGIASAGDVLGLHPLHRVGGTHRRSARPAGILDQSRPALAGRRIAARAAVRLSRASRRHDRSCHCSPPVRRFAESFAACGRWRNGCPSANEQANLLTQLSIEQGRLLLRTRDGRSIEATGQLQLPLETDANVSSVVRLAEHELTDALFAQAIDREREGDLASAVELYRRVLLAEGPDPDVAFNLGNALMALGQLDAAAERFRQAAEADPTFADAWHNLGNVLLETGRCAEAIDAYSKAVSADPSYADAHYGLAGALEECSRFDEARLHWRAYLNLEPVGECADYARRRLVETEARPTG